EALGERSMNTKLDLADIQGNIAWGYRHKHFKQLFGTIEGEVGRWKDFLFELSDLVTHGRHAREATKATLNVGISYAGLQKLIPNWAPWLSERFPAYVAGMGKRAADLGDPENVDFDEWDGRHLWLAIHATDKRVLDERIATIVQLAKRMSL